MKHRRTSRHGNHRHDSNLPKTFGINEALGVSALALLEILQIVGSSIANFWRVTHSIHYKI